MGHDKPFVDDLICRQAANVEVFSILKLQIGDGRLDLLACNVEPQLEPSPVRGGVVSADEKLLDNGLDSGGQDSNSVGGDRHVAPPKKTMPCLLDDSLYRLLAKGSLDLVLGQKRHPDPVAAWFR